jgi:hypothetical protein
MHKYIYPTTKHRHERYYHNILPTRVEKTHPDNLIMHHCIYPEKLRFYEMQEKEHNQDFSRYGRATFRIMEIVHEPESRIYDQTITIFIEYNPELIDHIHSALLEIGYQWGYYSAKKYLTKNNKTNETAY